MGFVDVCWFADLELATPDRGTQHWKKANISRLWARRASVDPTSPDHRHQQSFCSWDQDQLHFFLRKKLNIWDKLKASPHPKNLPSCTKESTTSCVMSSDQKRQMWILPSWEVTYVPWKAMLKMIFLFQRLDMFASSLEFMLYPELMDQNGESTLKNKHQWHWFDSWCSWLIDEICQIIRWCLPKASVNRVNPGCVEDQFQLKSAT